MVPKAFSNAAYIIVIKQEALHTFAARFARSLCNPSCGDVSTLVAMLPLMLMLFTLFMLLIPMLLMLMLLMLPMLVLVLLYTTHRG